MGRRSIPLNYPIHLQKIRPLYSVGILSIQIVFDCNAPTTSAILEIFTQTSSVRLPFTNYVDKILATYFPPLVNTVYERPLALIQVGLKIMELSYLKLRDKQLELMNAKISLYLPIKLRNIWLTRIRFTRTLLTFSKNKKEQKVALHCKPIPCNDYRDFPVQ